LANPDISFSLYVHVPFCRSKCFYCDFFSVPNPDPDLEARVVCEILEQAEFFRDVFGIDGVETAYVGGGTPSVLRRDILDRLLRGVSGFTPEEWTVEANPESLDEQFLNACDSNGVTRLSVGIQTGRDGLVTLLGRPGKSDDNARALRLLTTEWAGEVNLDFLAGIPGQEPEDMERDLACASDSRIGHASLYSLTVEPDTELYRRIADGRIRSDPEEKAEDLWFQGKRLLEQAGYANYEISNFARPGRECRHNMRYWRLEPYIGAGPGAVSTVPAALAAKLGQRIADAAGDACVVRLTNPRDVGEYLCGRPCLWGMEAEAVSDEDFLLETLMMGLRTASGISRRDFKRRFGGDLSEILPGCLESWRAEGLAEEDEEAMRLTEQGRLQLDGLLRETARRIHEGVTLPRRILWP
jgi:oxygen-independent coproporphyrinogen III oxidase